MPIKRATLDPAQKALLRRAVSLSRQVTKADARRLELMRERNQAIIECLRAGITEKHVADETGFSRAGLYKMRRDRTDAA